MFKVLLQSSVLITHHTRAHLAMKVAALRTLDCHRSLSDKAVGCWLRQNTNGISLNAPYPSLCRLDEHKNELQLVAVLHAWRVDYGIGPGPARRTLNAAKSHLDP